MNAGRCDSCKYTGPLYEFRNDLVEPEIRFNLCQKCIRKAYKCIQFFIHTPAGKQALVKKIAEMKKPDGFTVRV
jgi:hypothetical protein